MQNKNKNYLKDSVLFNNLTYVGQFLVLIQLNIYFLTMGVFVLFSDFLLYLLYLWKIHFSDTEMTKESKNVL